MTSTAESREDVSKQQSFITYSLQLNGIHLLLCVIVLRISYRLVNLDMGTVYTTYDPFKTISIFKSAVLSCTLLSGHLIYSVISCSTKIVLKSSMIWKTILSDKLNLSAIWKTK